MKIYFIDANNTTPQINYPLIETLYKEFKLNITYFSSNYSEHTNYYDENYSFKKRYIFPKLINKINLTFFRRFIKIFSYSFSSFIFVLTSIIKKPDIIHYNWLVNPFFDYFMIAILKSSGIKVILTQHNYYQHGRKKLRFFENKIFSSVDNIICLSKFVANQFDSKYQKKIVVIEHGNTYEKDIKINVDIDEKESNGKIKILFIGGIFPYKGVELLINAISNIDNEDILLYILGKGDDNYIKDLKQKLILHHMVDRTFFEKDYISYKTLFHTIKKCSFGVLPYKESTQSGVPFLFYNLHKPLIVTNVGGLAENIDKRFTKVINPNVSELEEALKSLILDIKNGKIKDKDFEDFLSNHRWINTVKKYYEFYKSII